MQNWQTKIVAMMCVGALPMVWAHAQDDDDAAAAPPPKETASQPERAGTMLLWDSDQGTKNPALMPWGNGEAKPSRDYEFLGQETLKITTRAPREGVYFDLSPAVDFAPYKNKGYLRFRLRFADASGRGGRGGSGRGGTGGTGRGGFGRGGGGATTDANPQFAPGLADDGAIRVQARPQLGAPPAGFPGAGLPPAGFPGGGLPGGGLPGGRPGQGGETTVPTGPPPQSIKLKQLLVTLVLDEGVMSGEIDIDAKASAPDDKGWRLFSVPVKNLRSTANAQGAVQRIVVTGDGPDTFYLSQVALVVDSGAMTVSLRRATDPPGSQVAEIALRPNAATRKAPITLVADVEAGTADPIIEWNFNADNNPVLDPPAQANNGGGAPDEGMAGGGPRMPGDGMANGEEEAPIPLGPRIDATGSKATFSYPNDEQSYRVEVTVRDRLGKKRPITASVRVLVRG